MAQQEMAPGWYQLEDGQLIRWNGVGVAGGFECISRFCQVHLNTPMPSLSKFVTRSLTAMLQAWQNPQTSGIHPLVILQDEKNQIESLRESTMRTIESSLPESDKLDFYGEQYAIANVFSRMLGVANAYSSVLLYQSGKQQVAYMALERTIEHMLSGGVPFYFAAGPMINMCGNYYANPELLGSSNAADVLVPLALQNTEHVAGYVFPDYQRVLDEQTYAEYFRNIFGK